jgi:hypothetical protein
MSATATVNGGNRHALSATCAEALASTIGRRSPLRSYPQFLLCDNAVIRCFIPAENFPAAVLTPALRAAAFL